MTMQDTVSFQSEIKNGVVLFLMGEVNHFLRVQRVVKFEWREKNKGTA
jgi:hypothetical protein